MPPIPFIWRFKLNSSRYGRIEAVCMREHRAITILIDLQSPQFVLLAPQYRSSAASNGWWKQWPIHQLPGVMDSRLWADLQRQIDQKGYAAYAGALPAVDGQFYVWSTLPGTLRTPRLDCPVCGSRIRNCFKRRCQRTFCMGSELIIDTRAGKKWLVTCPNGHELRDDVPIHLTDDYKEAMAWKKANQPAPD